jgi:hypothetical protein
MNCNEVRDFLSSQWGGALSAEVREHLPGCAGCAAYLRHARLVHAGFRALAEETAPEPSLGFAARLVRRLHDWEEKGERSEFFEAVGRRFVYATLALTLALLLSLALPSSGPVRGVEGAEFLGLQSNNQAAQPDVIGADFADSRELPSGKISE